MIIAMGLVAFFGAVIAYSKGFDDGKREGLDFARTLVDSHRKKYETNG